MSERRHPTPFPGFNKGLPSIAKALVEHRVKLGLTQTEVAARMGTSQSAVARIESGADVRLSTLERYAAAIGKELDWRLK